MLKNIPTFKMPTNYLPAIVFPVSSKSRLLLAYSNLVKTSESNGILKKTSSIKALYLSTELRWGTPILYLLEAISKWKFF